MFRHQHKTENPDETFITVKQPYRYTYPVYSFLTDHKNRLTPSNLANFLQDIAGRNAHELGWAVSDLNTGGKTWVLSRLYIEMNEMPGYQREVVVETWPTGGERLFAYRDFRVLDEQNREIGKARSAWVIMDLNTRRPEFVPESVKEMKDVYPVGIMELPRAKVPGVQNGESEVREVKVRRSDLDVNRHVNNVKFLEWALDAIDQEFYEQHRVTSIDIVFKAEVLHDDAIQSLIRYEEQTTHHTIKKGDAEVCLIRVTWQQD